MIKLILPVLAKLGFGKNEIYEAARGVLTARSGRVMAAKDSEAMATRGMQGDGVVSRRGNPA
jgi:hypothetical protein